MAPRPALRRMTAAASLSILLAAAAPARICLDPPAQAACLSWSSDGTNISFVGSWPALPSPYVVGWGGWGISAVSCGSMYPASMWMAILGPGGVVLEDRFAVSHTVPQCRKQPLSYVTASRVEPDGAYSVSWTRPLVAPPSSGQPSIVAGSNVSLIGAVYMGSPLDLRPCEPSGIPVHTTMAAFTVQLVDSDAPAPAAAGRAPIPAIDAAAAAGLVAAVPVCVTGNGALSNFARVSPRGVEHFYGTAGAPGYLGVTAVDTAGRRLHALAINASGVGYNLASIDIDTGLLISTCGTGILVPPSGGSAEDLGLAWDAVNASLIVSACTDTFCAGYVQVSRLQPGSCALAPVVKVPTDPAASVLPGAAAFDAASGIFVMSLTQTLRGETGLVLVAVDMGTGNVTNIYNEARRGLDVVALVPEAGAAAFVGVATFLDASQFGLALVRYDAAGNKLTRAPALPGVSQGALPGSGALDPRSGIFYFLTPDAPGGGTRVLGVHSANGTLASAGTLPGDPGQTPSAFFFA